MLQPTSIAQHENHQLVHTPGRKASRKQGREAQEAAEALNQVYWRKKNITPKEGSFGFNPYLGRMSRYLKHFFLAQK
jgi:hypothetical protein